LVLGRPQSQSMRKIINTSQRYGCWNFCLALITILIALASEHLWHVHRSINKQKHRTDNRSEDSKSWQIVQVILSFGFEMNVVDDCMYQKFSGNKYIFLVLYVDDILLATNNIDMLLFYLEILKWKILVMPTLY